MIKTFCDACSAEIQRSYVGDRLTVRHTTTKGVINAQVTAGIGPNGTWNGGHLCKPCVVKAVTEGAEVDA